MPKLPSLCFLPFFIGFLKVYNVFRIFLHRGPPDHLSFYGVYMHKSMALHGSTMEQFIHIDDSIVASKITSNEDDSAVICWPTCCYFSISIPTLRLNLGSCPFRFFVLTIV